MKLKSNTKRTQSRQLNISHFQVEHKRVRENIFSLETSEQQQKEPREHFFFKKRQINNHKNFAREKVKSVRVKERKHKQQRNLN